MKVQKAHKILLDVNPETDRLFVSWCGAAPWSYNASFSVETEVADPIEKQERVTVGVDAGIKHLAVLSDGKKFDNLQSFYRLERLLARAQRQMARKQKVDNLQSFYRLERLLARAQRQMARKQKGSKRWQKARLRVQRIHKRLIPVPTLRITLRPMLPPTMTVWR